MQMQPEVPPSGWRWGGSPPPWDMVGQLRPATLGKSSETMRWKKGISALNQMIFSFLKNLLSASFQGPIICNELLSYIFSTEDGPSEHLLDFCCRELCLDAFVSCVLDRRMPSKPCSEPPLTFRCGGGQDVRLVMVGTQRCACLLLAFQTLMPSGSKPSLAHPREHLAQRPAQCRSLLQRRDVGGHSGLTPG